MRLISTRGLCRLSEDVNPAAAFVEGDLAIHQGEQSPIAACADVFAGNEFGPALTNQNAAGADHFTAISFHAEPFADAIASVADAALTFLMCHRLTFNYA